MLRLTWHSEPSTMNKLYTNRTGRTRLGKRRVHPWRVKRKRRVQAFTCNIDPSHTLLHCRQLREDVKCISVLHAHVTCANQLFLVFLQCRYPHALSRPWGWVEDGWCCFGLVWGWFVGVKLARVLVDQTLAGFQKAGCIFIQGPYLRTTARTGPWWKPSSDQSFNRPQLCGLRVVPNTCAVLCCWWMAI